MTRVVGLDLSLTSSGLSDGQEHLAVQTTPAYAIEYRLASIVEHVATFASKAPTDLAVIEAGAFSRNSQPGHEELAALRLMVRIVLTNLGVPFALVPPTTLKLYTSGYGKATKGQMVEAVKLRHGLDLSDVKVKDGRHDMADALALAAMGYAWLGSPLATTGPPGPRQSLLAVKWPVPEFLNP